MRLRVGDLEIDPDMPLSNWDAIAIEKEAGLTLKEFGAALKRGSALAMTALVWTARKQAGEPLLKFRQVEFDYKTDLEYIADDGEKLAPAVDEDGAPLLDDDGDPILRHPSGALVDPKAPAAGPTGNGS